MLALVESVFDCDGSGVALGVRRTGTGVLVPKLELSAGRGGAACRPIECRGAGAAAAAAAGGGGARALAAASHKFMHVNASFLPKTLANSKKACRREMTSASRCTACQNINRNAPAANEAAAAGRWSLSRRRWPPRRHPAGGGVDVVG